MEKSLKNFRNIDFLNILKIDQKISDTVSGFMNLFFIWNSAGILKQIFFFSFSAVFELYY